MIRKLGVWYITVMSLPYQILPSQNHTASLDLCVGLGFIRRTGVVSFTLVRFLSLSLLPHFPS